MRGMEEKSKQKPPPKQKPISREKKRACSNAVPHTLPTCLLADAPLIEPHLTTREFTQTISSVVLAPCSCSSLWNNRPTLEWKGVGIDF
jgi:hypothetical protein